MSTRNLAACAVVLLVALLAPPGVAAQASAPNAGRVYFGGSIFAVMRPAGPGDYHYVTPMVGGTTAGIGGTLGVHLTRSVNAGVEVDWLGSLSRPLNFDHWGRWYEDVTVRETTIGLFVQLQPMKGSIRVEPVFGWMIAFRNTLRANRRGSEFWPSPPVWTSWPDLESSATDLGIGIGADVVAVVTPRLAVVASFRWAYFSGRYVNPAMDERSVGLGNEIYHFGTGLRWTIG